MAKLLFRLALLGGFNLISLFSYSMAGEAISQILASCAITAIELQDQSSCDPVSNTYSQELLITYSNEPSSGTLDVNGQNFSITGSPQLITLEGLISDGQPVDVTAGFSDSTSCTLSVPDLFTAPEECLVCLITDLEAGFQTGCDPATNTYTQEVLVTYSGEPLNGLLEVNGQFFAITGSPQMITLTGLVANGLSVAATARFSANTQCSYTEANLFVSPEECFEECNIQAVLAGEQSNCNPVSNTYSQQVVVVYQFAPSSGTLEVNGKHFPIIGSPQTVVLQGLVSDGGTVDVTAKFSDIPDCQFIEPNLFTAPEDCAPNQAPLAVADTLSTESEVSADIDILGNDTDSDGNIDPGSVLITEAPSNGSLILSPDGKVSYIPNLGFSGTDSFTYTVNDNEGAVSNLATVVINVDLLTALGAGETPGVEGITFSTLGSDILVNVNHGGISKLAVNVVDVQGQLVHRGSFTSNIREQYRLGLPTAYRNKLLLISVITDQGNYSKKLVIAGS